MLLSVIVPTHNRAPSLKRLLQSLDAIDCREPRETEVLVVNNGSSDATAELLSMELSKPRPFTLQVLEEKRQGKANALNVGLAYAKGDILVAIDDDVVVHPEFLVKHLECYRVTGFDAVQGRVLPGQDPGGKPADPARLREYNIPLIDHGSEYREIRGLTGTNMSFKREVFETVGLFDPRLGPGAAGFSEDTEYSMRIRQAGFKIGYTPHAIVYHELDPRRYGRAYNRNVEFRKGVSRSIYRCDSIFFRVMPNLLVNCFRYGVYQTLGLTQKAYRAEGRIVKSWGYLAGRARQCELFKASLRRRRHS
jgi:glycosyltransferase involved in cell wall biosynthesis